MITDFIIEENEISCLMITVDSGTILWDDELKELISSLN